jgi:hypothetical protein
MNITATIMNRTPHASSGDQPHHLANSTAWIMNTPRKPSIFWHAPPKTVPVNYPRISSGENKNTLLPAEDPVDSNQERSGKSFVGISAIKNRSITNPVGAHHYR